jgi:hypothetical protein
MKKNLFVFLTVLAYCTLNAIELPKAFVDGVGPDWRELGEADFADVNGLPETWTWNDSTLYCTGEPIGVMRTAKKYTNFELVLQWKHLKFAGNSGVFVWVQDAALTDLEPGKLPKQGIECQILDHGYAINFEKENGKKPEWFTSNGDIFAVGESKLNPFPPTSPNGSRSFPRKNLSKGVGEWNHYYIRCLNGEVRLWVNGEEVSGGNNAEPRSGYFCLEAEGSPIEFKNIRVRELP